MNAGARGRRQTSVHVIVAGPRVPVWITLLLDDLAAGEQITLAGLTVVPELGGPPPVAGRLAGALARVDGLVFGRRARSLGTASADDVCAWAAERGIPVDVAGSVGSGSFGTAGSGAPPDVLLDLTLEARASASVTAASGDALRAPVWWLQGVPVAAGDIHGRLPQAVDAVVRGRRVVAFELCARALGERDGVVLRRGLCPVHPSSPLMTGEYLAASARQLIVQMLGNGALTPPPGGVGGATASAQDRAGARPPARRSAGEHVRELAAAARFFMRAAASQRPKVASEAQWHLLAGEQPADALLPDPSRLGGVAPPPGTYWADPFVVTHAGVTHVFFEEFVYATRCGRIAVSTLDAGGVPGPPRTALDLGTHLSYPCVFVHDGHLYMAPEAADGGSLDLYECAGAPDRWERRRPLVEGVPLVDATIFPWDRRWWMFASLQKPAGLRTAELLLLYSTDDPVDGVWTEHPQSPLAADVTRSRPAGAPFVRNGRLYRLSQDGSRDYGWAISVSEVLTLTPEAYADRQVALIRPEWAPDLCGTHTLNRDGTQVVMDACHVVRRAPWRARAQSMRD